MNRIYNMKWYCPHCHRFFHDVDIGKEHIMKNHLLLRRLTGIVDPIQVDVIKVHCMKSPGREGLDLTQIKRSRLLSI